MMGNNAILHIYNVEMSSACTENLLVLILLECELTIHKNKAVLTYK